MQSHVKSAHRMGTPIHGEVDPTVKKTTLPYKQTVCPHHKTRKYAQTKNVSFFCESPIVLAGFMQQPTSDAHSNAYLISANLCLYLYIYIFISIQVIFVLPK